MICSRASFIDFQQAAHLVEDLGLKVTAFITVGTSNLQIPCLTDLFAQVVARWLGIANASAHFLKLH